MDKYASLCVYWRWPKRIQRIQMVTVLSACFLIHLSLGTIYTYGNLAPYLVSYARKRSSPSDLRTTDAVYVYAFQAAGQGTSMVIGGILEKRFGPRLVTLFGGWLMSLGVLLSYLAIQKSFWILLLTYGAMFGLGVGLAYVPPIACAMRWLPKYKGVATGIVVSGFGLSALIFNAIQTAYINPWNYQPKIQNENSEEKYFEHSDLLNRVPNIFLILGGLYALMQLIGAIFLVNPPPSDGSDYQHVFDGNLSEHRKRSDSIDSISLHSPDYNTVSKQNSEEENGSNTSIQGELENSTKLGSERPSYRSRSTSNVSSYASELEQSTVSSWSSNYIYNVAPLQLLRKPNFYILWIMFLCAGITISFIAPLYKTFGLDKVTEDDHFLTIAGAVSAVFNLLGRIVWGALADFTTYKFAFVIQGAFMTCLIATFYATSAAGKVMFFFWICGVFFCIGGYFSLFPTAVARCFGQENVSINYGMLFTAQVLGGLIASFISHILVHKIHWYGLFLLLAGFNIVEYVLAMCYRHKRYIRLHHPDYLHKTASRIKENSIKFPDDTDSDSGRD